MEALRAFHGLRTHCLDLILTYFHLIWTILIYEGGVQAARSRLWGPIRPSSCAEALASQLREQVKGEMTDELSEPQA